MPSPLLHYRWETPMTSRDRHSTLAASGQPPAGMPRHPGMGGTWFVLAALLGVSLLSGCTSASSQPMPMTAFAPAVEVVGDAQQQSSGPCGRRYAADIGVELSLIERMLDDGKPRSAAAHLEAGDYGLPIAWRLEGDARRAIGDVEGSNRAYEALLGTCLVADGYRGLARNAFRAGRHDQAMTLMRQARESRPIDPRIRNDLGYLLLLAGESQQAAEEFRTALELDPSHQQAAANLVLALRLSGQAAQAERTARRLGVDARLLAAPPRTISPAASPAERTES